MPADIGEFRRRAGRIDGPFDGDRHGDHRLNPDTAPLFLARPLKPAAVLFGVVDRPDGPAVLLTQRTAELRAHSGQVAFPGGRIDPEDRSAEAAALREAEEEIGLDPGAVDIVGRLPDYLSGSGYRIAPVLAVIDPGHRLRLNPREVAAAFETPLDFLLDDRNWRRDSRVWEGKERYFWTVPWRDRTIWGVTAGIIRAGLESLWP